jgi:hypothetical protein
MGSCWIYQTRAFPDQSAGQDALSPAATMGTTAKNRHPALVHRHGSGHRWHLRGLELFPNQKTIGEYKSMMNILIENGETGEFLDEQGGWTKNPKGSKVFKNKRLAFTAARAESAVKFNIVLHFPQTNQFVNLDHGRGKGEAGESRH